MHMQPADTKRSEEFQCPECGSLAFEVLEVQWFPDGDGRTQELGRLWIKCLGCLHAFEHPLRRGECNPLFSDPPKAIC